MANWDEDSITMGVEAARDCLNGTDPVAAQPVLRLDHAALQGSPERRRHRHGIDRRGRPDGSDVAGSQKAGTSALISGLTAAKSGAPTMVVAADKRMARVASANELQFGDAAAALLCGTDKVIAKLVGHHSASMDFVDHFRGEDADFDYTWEERWIRDEGYVKIVPPAIKAALAAANSRAPTSTTSSCPR